MVSKTPLRAPHLSALVAAPPGQMPPCRERGVFFGLAVAVAVGWRGSFVCLDKTNDRNMAKIPMQQEMVGLHLFLH